jgi:hypothetical protein
MQLPVMPSLSQITISCGAKPLSIVSESDRTCLLYLTYTPGCVEILRMEYDGILKYKFISIFTYSHVGFLFEHTEILDRHIGHNFKIFFYALCANSLPTSNSFVLMNC